MNVLKIVTFNTWNCQGHLSARLSLMHAQLKALEADIILLQEVFAEAPSGLDVAQDLAAALDMNPVYAPARKKLRKFEGRPVLCHSGLAILVRGDIEDQKIIQLPQDERDGERLGLIARLRVHGRAVTVGNVHLTHLPGENELRESQLRALATVMAEEGDADLFVIGGDMNLAAGHPVLHRFAEDWAYRLVGFGAGEPPASTLNPVNGAAAAAGVIDHVLLKADGVPVRAAQAQAALDAGDDAGVFPSDHKALLVRVALGDKDAS